MPPPWIRAMASCPSPGRRPGTSRPPSRGEERPIQKARSAGHTRARGAERRRVASCRRSARFLRASSARVRKAQRRLPSRLRSRANMGRWRTMPSSGSCPYQFQRHQRAGAWTRRIRVEKMRDALRRALRQESPCQRFFRRQQRFFRWQQQGRSCPGRHTGRTTWPSALGRLSSVDQTDAEHGGPPPPPTASN